LPAHFILLWEEQHFKGITAISYHIMMGFQLANIWFSPVVLCEQRIFVWRSFSFEFGAHHKKRVFGKVQAKQSNKMSQANAKTGAGFLCLCPL
jgi:hypothetical protein